MLLSTLSRFCIKTSIICGLATLTLLGGCSSVRLAYDNGPRLTWWWLDGYADFNTEQTPPVKQAIERLFAWHRSTQLAEYIPVLQRAQAAVLEPTTPAQACAWQAEVRTKLDPTFDFTMRQLADLVPLLGEVQFSSIERRYGKGNEDMRDDFLQPDPARRQAASVDRTVERAERLYGRLGAAQRRVVDAGIAASPFNPELWLEERRRRQADTLQTLRKLQADRADMPQRLAALRGLAERVEQSPDPTYRAYQLKLAEYNCVFAAQLHNATTLKQRRAARDRIKGWEDDLRSLIAGD